MEHSSFPFFLRVCVSPPWSALCPSNWRHMRSVLTSFKIKAILVSHIRHCGDSYDNTMANRHLHKHSKYTLSFWVFMNTLFYAVETYLSTLCIVVYSTADATHCVRMQSGPIKTFLKAVVRKEFNNSVNSLTWVQVTLKYCINTQLKVNVECIFKQLSCLMWSFTIIYNHTVIAHKNHFLFYKKSTFYNKLFAI